MRSLITRAAAVCAALMMIVPAAHAEEAVEEESRLKLGADFALAVPLGDWSDVANIGIGFLLRLEYELATNLDLRGRLGFIGHFKKDQGAGVESNTLELPILFGVKYAFGEGSTKPYVAVDLGITRVQVKVDGGFISASASDWEFGASLGGGVEFGAIDVGLQFWIPSFDAVEQDSAFFGLLATVGFNFIR